MLSESQQIKLVELVNLLIKEVEAAWLSEGCYFDHDIDQKKLADLIEDHKNNGFKVVVWNGSDWLPIDGV